MKKEKEERSVTARPIGEAYTADTTHSMRPLDPPGKDGWRNGPAGTLIYGGGCYRRVPTRRD